MKYNFLFTWRTRLTRTCVGSQADRDVAQPRFASERFIIHTLRIAAVWCYKLDPWLLRLHLGLSVARKRKSKSKVLGWFVLETHQFAEFDARRQLGRQGFEVELPMMLARLCNIHGERKRLPLFEGYIFVRECEDWWSINGTRGVSRVMMSCGRPAVVADADLQFFLSVSVDKLGYYVDPVEVVRRVGDRVSPRSGPWSGHYTELTSLDRDGRCELLYELLGRKVRVVTQVSELA